jgi:hypothetical protein
MSMVRETSPPGPGAPDPDLDDDTLHLDDQDRPAGVSGGLARSLMLILMGVSIGVFWREVFQLTVKLFNQLAGG